MNRNQLINKARQILAEVQELENHKPWVNLCGTNPPPEGWKGEVLNFSRAPVAGRKQGEPA